MYINFANMSASYFSFTDKKVNLFVLKVIVDKSSIPGDFFGSSVTIDNVKDDTNSDRMISDPKLLEKNVQGSANQGTNASEMQVSIRGARIDESSQIGNSKLTDKASLKKKRKVTASCKNDDDRAKSKGKEIQ